MARKSVVVVVGGGLAGLAATAALKRQEGFVVHMLEASSRFGGRVKSVHIPDENGVSVPLGAMYFHGEKGNSLLDFAVQRGIVRREDGRDGKASWMDILSDGTRLPKPVVQRYEEVFRDILSTVTTQGGNGMTMNEYVLAQFNRRTASLAAPPQCSPLSLLECFLYSEGIMEGSKSLEDVGVLRYEDFVWLEGIRSLLFDGNPMQQIVDSLVDDLPSESLHLNCEVESITWNQEEATHPVTVHCTNGDQYSADHVILTVSLGVLKKNCNSSFFNPPLSMDKQEAIKSMGFGAINKVVVQFPEPLLKEGCDSIRLYYKDRSLAEQFPWTRGLHRFHTIPGTNILLVWFAGDHAAMIEQITDSELAEGICRVFERFFQKAIPPPTMVVSSKWYGDPLFCGSYSYSALGSTKQHRSALAAPLEGRTPLQLLFAGEATHPTLFSTANAAYDTGLREAQRLIDFHTMQK